MEPVLAKFNLMQTYKNYLDPSKVESFYLKCVEKIIETSN